VFLAFTDDDCVPAANWLETLEARLAISPDCAVGGRALNALPNNPYATATQLLLDYLYSYYNANPEHARFLASNNLSVPSDCFQDIGGFPLRFSRAGGEDREFCKAWLRRGYRLIYAPEVLVWHLHRLRIHTFLRQHFNYGRGAFHFHAIDIQKGQKRTPMEPLSFYINLLCYPFSASAIKYSPLFVLLFLLSQIGNAAGYAWEKSTHLIHVGK
jgi:GT2 family glycosyltransferase